MSRAWVRESIHRIERDFQRSADTHLVPVELVAMPDVRLYLKDEWAKRHPIFEGLQAGGLMDYTVYREIIPHLGFVGQSPPLEAVAGACKTSQGYESGLLVAVHACGEGRLVMNALRVREELETSPVAERLLRNMLRYAAAGG